MMIDAPFMAVSRDAGTRHGSPLKAVPLSSFTLSETTGLPREATGVEALFAGVPPVYRCVTLRAQAVSSVPVEIVRKGSTTRAIKADIDALVAKLPDLVYRMEASLCLYGAAYLMPVRNRVKLIDVRYLAAPSVTPLYDQATGLAGFQRDIGAAKPETYKVEELVHVFLPDPTVEVGPGSPPIEAARRAATSLLQADTYVANFFEHGGVNITLLITDPATSESDLKKLETWWRRLTRGVKQAWQAIALRRNVEVKQLGYPLDQLATDKLKATATRDIANAFGVPEYYLSSDVANFATAKSYDLTFTERVVVSELGIIGAALNAQLFGPLGYEVVFHPERLEVMQASEFDKAQAVSEVVGKPVLTVNEGRQSLGYEPLDEEGANHITGPTPATTTTVGASGAAGPASVDAPASRDGQDVPAKVMKALLTELTAARLAVVEAQEEMGRVRPRSSAAGDEEASDAAA